MKKVTFGIVNCNRLFYLKSCLESLLETTKSYDNKEVIVVDNASVEPGTSEYLKLLEERGIKVFRKNERNYANEFAIGLNTIISESTGDYVCLLQGDIQFVLNDWLKDIVNFYEKNLDVVGSIVLDAQRRSTIASRNIVQFPRDRIPMFSSNNFFIDFSRNPIAPAGDAFFSKKVLDQVYPWHEKNVNHEGSLDSETAMKNKVLQLMKEGKMPEYVAVMTSAPMAVAIYTDKRGTQGRVRGNKRYGDYWQAKDPSGFKYYEYVDVLSHDLTRPNSIEEVAKPIGFDRMVDAAGNWLKNPIRPETATEADWIEL